MDGVRAGLGAYKRVHTVVDIANTLVTSKVWESQFHSSALLRQRLCALLGASGPQIAACSDGPGTGATFVVTLKTTAKAVAGSNVPKPDLGVRSVDIHARILLVEDHADTAKMLSRLLEAYGYGTTLTSSVASALKAASEETFDLLVSDIGLPDASGYELMQKLKELYGMQGIALTGYGMEDDMRRGREAGFADHVVKPINIAQLDAVIRRVLGKN